MSRLPVARCEPLGSATKSRVQASTGVSTRIAWAFVRVELSDARNPACPWERRVLRAERVMIQRQDILRQCQRLLIRHEFPRGEARALVVHNWRRELRETFKKGIP